MISIFALTTPDCPSSKFTRDNKKCNNMKCINKKCNNKKCIKSTPTGSATGMTNATTEAMKEDDAALRLSSVANVEGASGKVVFVTETMIVVTIASNDVYKRCL